MRQCSSYILALCFAVRLCAQIPAGQLEFFEKKIRPVLAEKCYSCHSAKIARPMGGLRLDTREGGRKGETAAPLLRLEIRRAALWLRLFLIRLTKNPA